MQTSHGEAGERDAQDLAGVGYAQLLTPLLRFNSDGRTLLVVYGAILVSHGLLNHYGIRLVAWLTDFSVTVHILGVAVIIGLLLLFAPKQPVSLFFQARSTTASPYVWAFMLALVQAQRTSTGY